MIRFNFHCPTQSGTLNSHDNKSASVYSLRVITPGVNATIVIAASSQNTNIRPKTADIYLRRSYHSH